MKNFLFFTTVFIISSFNLFSQTIIWYEDFESYANGTQNATKWTTSANNCDGDGLPGTSADNYWGVRTTSGDKEFCCEDIEGLTCCSNQQGQSDNLWLSEVININGYTDISISFFMRAEGNMECSSCGLGNDLFVAEYQIDGGSWVGFSSICGVSDGYANVECIDVADGSSLRIRFLLGNQANDEEYYFDDVFVYEGSCSVVLPVELLYFSGDYVSDLDLNVLEWSTASEMDNSHFTIEHSVDGLMWSQVGLVYGAGNSSSVLKYNFEHRSLHNINYYRLKQFDYDGKEKKHNTISIVKDKDIVESVYYYNISGQAVYEIRESGVYIKVTEYRGGKVLREKVIF